MSYADRPRSNLGCLVAGAFLFLIGLPSLFGVMLGGPCASPDGCMDKPLLVLIVAIGVVLTALLILWLVNVLVGRARAGDD